MNALSSTRAGGDHGGIPRKLSGRAAIDTAGAPAHHSMPAQASLAIILASSAAEPADIPGGEPAIGTDAVSASPDAPEWIELLPAGVFYGRDGRGPYRLDDPESVIAATRALRMEAGIPVDYDHATDLAAPQGHPAPAAGWIKELKVRDGALWGRVEWTERATQAIRAHEYRYISPVFQYLRADAKVIRLLRAGLTNNPNLYLTAISAAGDEEDQQMDQFDQFVTQLRQILGMDADASFDEILEAVGNQIAAAAAARQAAQSASAGDPARYVDVADFKKAVTELNALRAERAREKAEHAVNEAIRAGKLVPAQREWAIAYCAADPQAFGAFAARQPAMLAGEMLPPAPGAIHARMPESGAMLTTVESAICSQLGIGISDFVSRKQGRADFLKIRDNSQRE